MTLVMLLLAIAFCGFITWLVTLAPMPQVVKSVIIGLVVLFIIVFVLQNLGIATGLPRLRLW